VVEGEWEKRRRHILPSLNDLKGNEILRGRIRDSSIKGFEWTSGRECVLKNEPKVILAGGGERTREELQTVERLKNPRGARKYFFGAVGKARNIYMNVKGKKAKL